MRSFPFIFVPLHSYNSSIPLLYEDSHLIPLIPTPVPRIPTLIPRIPIIPLIPFPDPPFWLLQIAEVKFVDNP